MKNPFRSEAQAYRFVIGTAVYFIVIALATALGGRWVGLGVFVVLSVLALVWFFRRVPKEAPDVTAPKQHADDGRRILVVANETAGGLELRDAIRAAAGETRASVLVVCPALNSRLRHWASDDDAARAAAEERMAKTVAALEQLGFTARGEVGDADPVLAITDALRTFGADVVIISTHPAGRSNWLERGVVESARERFDVPIEHVVVDLEAAKV